MRNYISIAYILICNFMLNLQFKLKISSRLNIQIFYQWKIRTAEKGCKYA